MAVKEWKTNLSMIAQGKKKKKQHKKNTFSLQGMYPEVL